MASFGFDLEHISLAGKLFKEVVFALKHRIPSVISWQVECTCFERIKSLYIHAIPMITDATYI